MKQKRMKQIVNAYLDKHMLYLKRANRKMGESSVNLMMHTIFMPFPKTKIGLMVFLHEVGHTTDRKLWSSDIQYIHSVEHQIYADLFMIEQMNRLGLTITEKCKKDFEFVSGRTI